MYKKFNQITLFIVLFSLLSCVRMPSFTNEEATSNSIITERWKEALVIDLLSKTPELNIHRMNGQNTNQVFVLKGGGAELVCRPNADGSYTRVTDPANQGSYNYYNAVDRPIAHYMADIKPWIYYANTPNDPTSKSQRLDAYALDLCIGISATLKDRDIDIQSQNVKFPSPEEYEEAKKWVKAFKKNSVI